ncbi:MAG TPA: hypothetical protein VGU64_04990, partial [Terriglobales bacterium]|nr:hypothetical protein [Terriglobales bacterium]
PIGAAGTVNGKQGGDAAASSEVRAISVGLMGLRLRFLRVDRAMADAPWSNSAKCCHERCHVGATLRPYWRKADIGRRQPDF